jgi:hypothetical protein
VKEEAMSFSQFPGQNASQRAMQQQRALRDRQMQYAWWQRQRQQQQQRAGNQQHQQAGNAPMPITDTLGWFGRLVRGLLTLVWTLAFLGAAAFGVFALVEEETEIAMGAGAVAIAALLLRHWTRTWGRS